MQNQFLFPEDLENSTSRDVGMADSAIDLSIPRALSPEPILAIDYDDREDSNEDGGYQDSGFELGSDPANHRQTAGEDEDENLDDTAEVDVETISDEDDFDVATEDYPVPVESSTPTRSRSSSPAPSAASSRQSSPARSNSPADGATPSRGTTPLPSTSYPEGLEGDKEVSQHQERGLKV